MAEPEVVTDRPSRLEMSPPPYRRGSGGAVHQEYRNAFVYVSALETGTVTPENAE